MRVGRQVIYERSFDHENRIVSFGLDAAGASDPDGFLAALGKAQRFAESDAGDRPVSLELVATVQHGWPTAMSYTMHFEVTPCDD